jgi:chitinase
MRIDDTRIVLASWMALALGCGGADASPGAGADTPIDAGVSVGEASAPDAGQRTDAESASDAAPMRDAGNAGDASTHDAAPDSSIANETELAPYFYTWGWGSNAYAFSSLVDMKAKGGPNSVTLAFVLSNGGCSVTTDIQDHLADVKAFVAAGGHVKASFGGADGTYIESACGDAGSLAAALSGFVDSTGVTDLDFDIEQGASTSNATINAMRAKALKQVQTDKGIRVAFTLPVGLDGLDALGKAVVQSAIDAGVAISFVNVMTMDYGLGQADLGQVAIGSADGTASQLVTMIPGLTLAAAYRMVGATPMIGKNDDGSVFSLANAQALATWAGQKHLGLLAFWAIQRDEPCPSGQDINTCSEVNGATFQFNNVFAAVAH